MNQVITNETRRPAGADRDAGRFDPVATYGGNNLIDQPTEHYMALYRQADPRQISRRLGIPFDPERRAFTVGCLGVSYLVTHPDLEVVSMSRDVDPLAGDGKARILLLRFLLYASVFPHDGQYRSYRDLPSGDLYYAPFRGRCLDRLLRTYGDRPEELCRAAGALGGVACSGADAGCEIELFDGLYVRFLLWARDEEYPPSGQILFSSNFPAAFSTYDITEAAEMLLRIMSRHR